MEKINSAELLGFYILDCRVAVLLAMTRKEVMMILKSEQSLFSKVEAIVKSLHRYQAPEIISMPVVEGHQAYLAWMQSWLKL